jgi:hypothetical protein
MVQAQQPDPIRRVGVLTGDGENDPEVKPRLTAFEQGSNGSDGQSVATSRSSIALPGTSQSDMTISTKI